MNQEKIFQICINNSSISINKSDNLVGEIYFLYGGKYFPYQGHSDFVALVLLEIADELWNLMVNTTSEATVWFHDGPFNLLLSKPNQKILIKYRRRWDSFDEIIDETEIALDAFLATLLDAMDQIIQVSNQLRWQSSDLALLIKAKQKVFL